MNWRLIARRIELFVLPDGGQDLVEYGMLAALIALVAMVAIGTLGHTVRTNFWDVVANLL
jgi:Flp pilus assembly pilin Flp